MDSNVELKLAAPTDLTTEAVAEKVEYLKQVLGSDFDAASNKSTRGTYEVLDSLLKTLYLRGVISAGDIKNILAGEDIFP